jgi:hypothetical protein
MPMVNGEMVEHVIYDCNERVQLHGDVYVQLIPVTRENVEEIQSTITPGQNMHRPMTEESCIGCFCVRENGDFIIDGCLFVIDTGVFYILKGLNSRELAFIAVDDEGRIKVVR